VAVALGAAAAIAGHVPSPSRSRERARVRESPRPVDAAALDVLVSRSQTNQKRLRDEEDDRVPEITIEMVEGRTLEQKRELAKRLTELVSEVLKVEPAAVTIVYHENRREDKAKGGVLFSDR
jgi:4-oxalocrotonate tautomerase